jgi:hypothetical protein
MKTFEQFSNKELLPPNTPKLWYHGTNSKFDRFDITYKGKNFEQSTLGIYFTQHITPPPYGSSAKEYAENSAIVKGGEAIIYECELDMKKPLVLNSNGWYNSVDYLDRNRNDIKKWLEISTYDSIISYDSTKKDKHDDDDFIAIVFNPDQIKIVRTYNKEEYNYEISKKWLAIGITR